MMQKFRMSICERILAEKQASRDRPSVRYAAPVQDTFTSLRTLPALADARWDSVKKGSGKPSKVILGIGQVHPVLRGRFEPFQARRIADVQHWIFQACGALHEALGVKTFGEEGLAGVRDRTLVMRLPEALAHSIKKECDVAGGPRRYLHMLAKSWRKALKRGDLATAREAHMRLNGLALLQAFRQGIGVFPIEQDDVHGRIGGGLDALSTAIKDIETSVAFKAVQAKGGKHLTKAEYDAAVERGKLVDQFNTLITHPDRERSILREVLEHAEKTDLTVFILGEAHRKPMLRLAKEHLSSDHQFIWLTPPSLWRWQTRLIRAGLVLAIIIPAAAWVLTL